MCWCLVLGVWLILPAAEAATGTATVVDIDSHIQSVTVFPDQALVTRRGHLACQAGLQTVRFASVPSSIEPESVAVKGNGTVSITLYGARVVTRQLAEAADPRVQQLETAITDVERRVRVLDDTSEVLQQEWEFLGGIGTASSEQVGKDLATRQADPQQLAGVLAFLDRELLENAKRRREARLQREELELELDRLRRELGQLHERWARETVDILVDLEAAASGECDLEVSYRLPGAGWRPVYEARCDTAASSLVIASYGMVQQQTGEEWTDVVLMLSTAQPSRSGRMPELESWYIKPWEPPVAMPYARGAAAEMKMMALASDAAAPMLQEAALAEAVVESSGPSVLYRLPKAESVPSDGQPHKVALRQTQHTVDLAYEATPKLAPQAYLRAQLTLGEDALYLPGQVQVFVDGAFVTTSSLDLLLPGQRLDLFLGVDERIRINYQQRQAKVDVSALPGLRGRSKTIDYVYVTTVENHLGAPAVVWVSDHLPVSQHDDIKVENIRCEPESVEEVDQKPGVRRWKLSLPTGGKQQIVLSYRVRHPLDMRIEGL